MAAKVNTEQSSSLQCWLLGGSTINLPKGRGVMSDILAQQPHINLYPLKHLKNILSRCCREFGTHMQRITFRGAMLFFGISL